MTFSVLQTLFLNVFLLAFSYTKEAALVITKESLDGMLFVAKQHGDLSTARSRSHPLEE